ncbi:MAG: hydrolase [Pseudomonadota bacterium]
MPVISSPFRPAWWLPGSHAQTLYPYFFRRHRDLRTRGERLELSDGDFLDLAWGPEPTTAEPGRPLVLITHGLEGSVQSGYVRGLLHGLANHGLRGVLMHWRGCSGEPNRLPRSYHAGETGDIQRVVTTLREREPETPLAAVGYSLGGSALLHWLAETGADNPLVQAVAVSVPFRLADADRRLSRGFSRVYQHRLLDQLGRNLRRKAHRRGLELNVDPDSLDRFRAFDDAVTAPLHGFRDAEDYYQRCSPRQVLTRIVTPTRLIHAADDPFMFPDSIPDADELSDAVTLERAARGGHVGFVEGRIPLRPRPYLERHVPRILREAFRWGETK